MVRRFPFLLFIAVAVLTSCSSLIQEEYRDPKQRITESVAPSQSNASRWVAPENGEFVIKRDWWKELGDAEFDKLIERATTDNVDLRLLVTRVSKAEIELTGAKRERWPKFSASASYADTRNMEHSRTTGDKSRDFSADTGLSWELDFWGKLKQQKEAQWAKYQATEADYRAGYLTLIGNLSAAYFTVRRLDEQRILHGRALSNASEALKLYERRQQGGLESTAMINNQKAEILRLKRELLEIDRQRKVKQNEIAFLLGTTAGDLDVSESPLRKRVKLIKFPSKLSVNLLERRPDIISAEVQVKQAYHMQENRRAARMPSISVGLSTNMTNAAISALTQNWTATILPKIEFPFLDPGTKTRLNLSEVDLEAARERYKRAVLNAIREVEDALINFRNHREQKAMEEERIAELESSHEKAMIRLKGGIISQLEVFETERRLLESRQKLLEIYDLILQDIVTLHNALGGGWE